MARYVVPVVVLLAMVGGYLVVAQTPDSKVAEPIITEKQLPNGAGGINDPSTTLQVASPSSGQVGRFVPFGVGLMLDTTNGTLYAQEGNPTRWKVVATMASELPVEIVPY